MDETAAPNSKGSTRLNPARSAISLITAPPNSTAREANTVLHDTARASLSEISSPPLHLPPDTLTMGWPAPGARYSAESSSSVSGVIPDSRAAAATRTLKADPDGRSRKATRSSAARSFRCSSRVISPETRSFGSAAGDEAYARTAPVAGSTATIAPVRLSNSRAATCWMRSTMVRRTSGGSTLPPNRVISHDVIEPSSSDLRSPARVDSSAVEKSVAA